MEFRFRVAILILNWNGAPRTLECLEHLKETQSSDIICLLDNGSTDDSVYLIEKWIQQWDQSRNLLLWFKSSQNLGFAGGCNFLIEQALAEKCEYVFLLNNDAWIEKHGLDILVERSAAKALVGPIIKASDSEQTVFQGQSLSKAIFGFDLLSSRSNNSMGYIEGSALLMPVKFLLQKKEETGFFFDERYFLYCEDVDLCLSARRLGYPLLIAREAVARHHVSQSGGGKGNRLAYYYITRNRLFLIKKWQPWLIYFCFSIYYFVSRMGLILYRKMQGQPQIIRQAIIAGLWDGFRGRGHKWKKHDL